MKFEEHVAHLEEIAKNIENENLPLEDAIKLYEEGVNTAKQCIESLNKNKDKISELTKQMESIFSGENNDI